MHFHRHPDDDIRPSCVEALHCGARDVSSASTISLIVLTALESGAVCPNAVSSTWSPSERRGRASPRSSAWARSSRPRSWAGWAIPPGSDPSQRSPCCRGRRRFPLPPVAFGRKTTLQGRQAGHLNTTVGTGDVSYFAETATERSLAPSSRSASSTRLDPDRPGSDVIPQTHTAFRSSPRSRRATR